MFDKRSDAWIKIYEVITNVMTYLIFTAGFAGGVCDCLAISFLNLNLGGGDDGFLDFIVWIIIFGIAAFFFLVFNMLIVQLLDNVNVIRKKTESCKRPIGPSTNIKQNSNNKSTSFEDLMSEYQ